MKNPNQVINIEIKSIDKLVLYHIKEKTKNITKDWQWSSYWWICMKKKKDDFSFWADTDVLKIFNVSENQ